MLYNYCSHIPQIPDDLINITEEEIRKIPNKFNGVKATKYSLHTVTKELKDFLKPYFDNDVNIAFQLITDELPVHKDYGRTNCYNYIIKSGGNVSTVWYDDNLKEIDRVIFPKHIWHNINVETFHNVVGINNTRIAISVWTKDESAIGEIKT
jgi:hypothetical protein